MPIQDQLAYSLGRKDQAPNKSLAKKIADSEDELRLSELIQFFDSKPHKELQKDCSLTLAWIAERNPKMIAPYVDYLMDKLNDPINRVIWGSMIALSSIAHLTQDQLYQALPAILDAMDKGTVVTRDHGYRILIVLYQNNKYQEDVFLLVLEQIAKAPSNQLGQYTENLIAVLDRSHKEQLLTVLEDRKLELVNPHHQKRLSKNLEKLYRI